MALGSPLVWMDLEMSGLDPAKERILEIAVVITDGELTVLSEGPDLVLHQPPSLLEAMDEWNTRHHTESGLLERVRASTLTEAEAEERVLTFIQQYAHESACPLAGNSVHQDRRFLRRYMPRVEAWLHYRNVDVSSVKELVRRWYPEVAAQQPSKRERHRALEDVLESIEELKYYRDTVFRPRS